MDSYFLEVKGFAKPEFDQLYNDTKGFIYLKNITITSKVYQSNWHRYSQL